MGHSAIFSWSAPPVQGKGTEPSPAKHLPPTFWCAPLLHRTRLSRRDDLVLDACFHQPFHWTHRFRFSSFRSLIFVASFRQRHLETRSPRPSSPEKLHRPPIRARRCPFTPDAWKTPSTEAAATPRHATATKKRRDLRTLMVVATSRPLRLQPFPIVIRLSPGLFASGHSTFLPPPSPTWSRLPKREASLASRASASGAAAQHHLPIPTGQ